MCNKLHPGPRAMWSLPAFHAPILGTLRRTFRPTDRMFPDVNHLIHPVNRTLLQVDTGSLDPVNPECTHSATSSRVYLSIWEAGSYGALLKGGAYALSRVGTMLVAPGQVANWPCHVIVALGRVRVWVVHPTLPREDAVGNVATSPVAPWGWVSTAPCRSWSPSKIDRHTPSSPPFASPALRVDYEECVPSFPSRGLP